MGLRDFISGTGPAARLCALLVCVAPVLAGCGSFGMADINDSTLFAPSAYGVAASPRVTRSVNVPRGGGRYMVGQPYRVAGRWFTPAENPNYDEIGMASWYGPRFHGRRTSNGEIYDQDFLSGAHPTLPLPSYVRVTNLGNNRSVILRINDRGPFVASRIVDVSRRAADVLGMRQAGTARVRVQYVGRAPLEGNDSRYLQASIQGPPLPPGSQGSGGSRGPGGMIGAFMGLFAYADEAAPHDAERAVNGAHEATMAIAAMPAELAEWRASIDEEAREVDIVLGAFADPAGVEAVLDAFALIGAVEVDQVSVNGAPATRLTLSYLKPGVTRADVAETARRLGLEGVVL